MQITERVHGLLARRDALEAGGFLVAAERISEALALDPSYRWNFRTPTQLRFEDASDLIDQRLVDEDGEHLTIAGADFDETTRAWTVTTDHGVTRVFPEFTVLDFAI